MPAMHHSLVADQYDSRASAYLNSPVHAQGEDLDNLAALVGERPEALALDMGCGGGHVSYCLAPRVGKVVACDLSAAMLDTVAAEAQRRGFANVETVQAVVDSLPFPSAFIDIVATRYSAHHWQNPEGGFAELGRVLKPGGLAVFMDLVAPMDSLVDTWLQTIELIRDPSHVRSIAPDQWCAALARAGFAVWELSLGRRRIDFPSWVQRMGTPAGHVEVIRALQRRAPREVAEALEFEADGSFTVDIATLVARRR